MMSGRLSLPEDLQGLNSEDLEALCEEIRQKIISVCLRNGGHIGASLGTVELAVALHRIFRSPSDKIIWDVGHQAYAHKLLTGRWERFETLRQKDGISGFLSRDESEHDVFGAGHSSTSISAALGFAYQSKDWTVAVIGDGGLTAGIAFEAMNNIRSPEERGPLLVVLNDNQMSISENIGGIHHLLASGEAKTFFDLFGFEYVGPLNGHDLPTLLATLNGIRAARPDRPVLLHVMTQKGKGYAPAESRPAYYHGVGPASGSSTPPLKAPAPGEASEKTWSDHFCDALIAEAEKDEKIVAITAAMSDGTGLLPFAKRFPERFFDVGIAEQHAITFAAALAANGWKPVCAIYSTFLQRGLDSLIHDVALQGLPVILAVDRAGWVGADGPTHHGVFDLAYAGMIPGVSIYTPKYGTDTHLCLGDAIRSGSPSLIRYPRGKAPRADLSTAALKATGFKAVLGLESLSERTKTAVISFGPCGVRVEKITNQLKPELKESVGLISVLRAKPLPEGIIESLLASAPGLTRVVLVEEGVRRGGLSVDFVERLSANPASAGISHRIVSYPDLFVGHGTLKELEEEFGFSDADIGQAVVE